MLKKIWHNNYALAALAGLANVLAFSPIAWWPFIFLTPLGLFIVVSRCQSMREALLCGYIASFIIMVGGFYWVVYTIHIFGYLPWIVAGLLFVLFCGFGALNFPIFTCLAYWSRGALFSKKRKQKELPQVTWWLFFAPALFTVTEWIIPKLFPWAIAHTLYDLSFAIQICELTGASILTFAICIGGGWAAYQIQQKRGARAWILWPACLWAVILGFGAYRLVETPAPTKKIVLGLVQANIGSLERLEASFGVGSKIQQTIERHRDLTEQALNSTPKPNLIIWPETAMPFLMDVDYGYSFSVKESIRRWKTPLITGAYAQVPGQPYRDYNAAFLFHPQADGTLTSQMYEKNILLAFGEYFPFGETFPILYRWFPQVSNFKWGTEQKIFTLDGTRIGVTVCYEAIVPSFVRKVAAQGIQVLVNLTNDSWFGPTSEPYQHGILSIFRAVESRVPLVRVTNTGRTFTVDSMGRVGPATPIYQPTFLNSEIDVPLEVPSTLFVRWGNWFVWLLAFSLVGMLALGRAHVPIFSRIYSRR